MHFILGKKKISRFAKYFRHQGRSVDIFFYFIEFTLTAKEF